MLILTRLLSSMDVKPATYRIFALALMIEIIASMTWYTSKPHQMIAISRYGPYISYLFCGFLVGLLDNPGYLRKTAVLGILLSIVAATSHWIAGQLGMAVDFTTASSAVFIALLLLPICIGCSMLGGALGSLLYRLAILRKRTGSGNDSDREGR